MKKTNYTINVKMMPVSNLKQAAMLKKYGIDKPSEFEITQLQKFGLTDHLKGIVATENGTVLCNWELVLIAQAAGIADIEVIIVNGLAENEIIQVIAVKNIRKKLLKTALVDLILDYRDYLTKDDAGVEWAKEIPGNSTDARIGTIVGYSYGMINGYQTINKLHPEFIEMMDKGEMTYTRAIEIINSEKVCDPTLKPGDDPITPKPVKAVKHHYAGEKNMVPCVPVESIQIRYADGRVWNVEVSGEKAINKIADLLVETNYSSKKESFKGGAEFHRLDSSDNNFSMELVIRNAA